MYRHYFCNTTDCFDYFCTKDYSVIHRYSVNIVFHTLSRDTIKRWGACGPRDCSTTIVPPQLVHYNWSITIGPSQLVHHNWSTTIGPPQLVHHNQPICQKLFHQKCLHIPNPVSLKINITQHIF